MSNQRDIDDPDRVSFIESDFYYSGCNRFPNLPTAVQVMQGRAGLLGFFQIRKSTPAEFRTKMAPLAMQWEDKFRPYVVSATLRLIEATQQYLDIALVREKYRSANRNSKGERTRITPFDDDYEKAKTAMDSAKETRGADFPLTLPETIALYEQIDPAIWLGVQGGYYRVIGENDRSLILPTDSLTAWCKGGAYDRTIVWQSQYTTRRVKIVDGHLTIID